MLLTGYGWGCGINWLNDGPEFLIKETGCVKVKYILFVNFLYVKLLNNKIKIKLSFTFPPYYEILDKFMVWWVNFVNFSF